MSAQGQERTDLRRAVEEPTAVALEHGEGGPWHSEDNGAQGFTCIAWAMPRSAPPTVHVSSVCAAADDALTSECDTSTKRARSRMTMHRPGPNSGMKLPLSLSETAEEAATLTGAAAAENETLLDFILGIEYDAAWVGSFISR